MKMLKQAIVCVGALALVACGGGGGDAGTSVFGGGTTTVPTGTPAASIDLIASSVTVPSGGDQITITATVKDSGNVGLPATAIRFASDSGSLTGASVTTNASGVATAVLTAGSNRSNRNIVVTATSGSAAGTITLPVSGTTLSYSGVTTVALGGTAQLTVTAVDSKGAPIAGMALGVASSLGNGLSATALTTDAQGTATLTYTASGAGSDTLTLSGGGSTLATVITISAAQFNFSSPAASTRVPVTTKQAVSVTYLSNNVAQPGKTVSFAATAGIITLAGAGPSCSSNTVVSSAVTDSTGKATVCVSSATASPATVQATLTNVVGVSAQATLPISFVAVTPSKVVLQITPTSLSPNPIGTTTQKATVLASVTDANGNPVSGVTVDFNRCADPSGGSLSQASAVTSSSGQATVQYIAGPTATASNGVLLQTSVEGFPAITLPPCTAGAANASNNTAALTVSQSALFLALGTGNTIVQLDTQTNEQDWVVYVTDSNGVAVSNVALTVKVLPVGYGKGSLVFGTSWGLPPNPTFCPNEDANYNGVLDPGEDFNLSGVLEPGNVISATTSSTSGASSGTVTTGSTGRATIALVYAKSYSNWVIVRLQVSAVVSGTESSTQQTFIAVGAAPDYASKTIGPPGANSPFGVGACSQPF